MSFLETILRPWRSPPAAVPVGERPEELRYWGAVPPGATLLGSATTTSGEPVTESSAMRETAVYACVRALSESIASLPLNVYAVQDDGDRTLNRNHRYWELLHDQPNTRMTSYQFRERIVCDIALWGTHYSLIEKSGKDISNLWPIRPDRARVNATRKNGVSVTVTAGDEDAYVTDTYDDSEILRIPGLSSNGLTGIPPIRLLANAIGASQAANASSARFFSQGVQSQGALKHPGRLSQEAQERLRANMASRHSGENAHKAMILEEGMDWVAMSMSPEDSQLLETRRFHITDIARAFRVPPHMIGDLERATFSNIEQQQIGFVSLTLAPLMARIESEINWKVLGFRSGSAAAHDTKKFLRGEFRAQVEALKIATESGILSRNEARRELDYPNEEGLDEFTIPMNMDTVGEEPEPVEDDAPPPPEPESVPVVPDEPAEADEKSRAERRTLESRQSRRTVRDAAGPLIESAAATIVKRETDKLRRILSRYEQTGDLDEFVRSVDELYGLPAADRGEDGPSGLHGFIERQLFPVIRAIVVQIVATVERETGLEVPGIDPDEYARGYVEVAAAQHVGRSRRHIGTAMAGAALVLDLSSRLDDWLANRAGQIAMQHKVEAEGASARRAYRAVGVTKFRWLTLGENCPMCEELDGQIVGVERAFVQSKGKVGDLQVHRDILHPPLHTGCDCIIVAET